MSRATAFSHFFCFFVSVELPGPWICLSRQTLASSSVHLASTTRGGESHRALAVRTLSVQEEASTEVSRVTGGL